MASFLSEDAPSERRTGLRAGGFFFDLGLWSFFDLGIEAAYAMKGVKSGDSDLTVALDYVELPVLAKFALTERVVAPVLFTGPAPGIKVVAERRSGSGEATYGDLVHQWDLGWVFGGGIETSLGGRRALLDLRYARGLKAVFDFRGPEDSDSDDKHQVVSIGVRVVLF